MTQQNQQATACTCHQTETYTHRPASCPAHGTAALQVRLDRAKRTRHQARLVQDGRVLIAGPWRSDHLAAVVDRRRILDHVQETGVSGSAEIHSAVVGGAA